MIGVNTYMEIERGYPAKWVIDPAQVEGGGKSDVMAEEYVLVVDDDPGIHAMLDLILRPLHVHLEGTLDGFEALDRVAAQRPSLVILDLMLPHLSGYDVLERLGQLPETADIPVLVYSATANQAEVLVFAWPEQVVGVLSKTAPVTEVRHVVKDVLSL